jgi:hypothetical protein
MPKGRQAEEKNIQREFRVSMRGSTKSTGRFVSAEQTAAIKQAKIKFFMAKD